MDGRADAHASAEHRPVSTSGRGDMTPLVAPSAQRARYWVVVSASFLAVLLLDSWPSISDVAAALYVVPVCLTVLSGRLRWVVNTTIAAVVATLLGLFREAVRVDSGPSGTPTSSPASRSPS